MPVTAEAIPGHLLIVDDNLVNLQVLFRTLRGAGHHVIPAQDAESTFVRLRHQIPDLILLDIMMPDVDGFELYRRLREYPPTAEVPVIFISALDDNEAIVRALRLGAVDYIAKPFRPEEVLARVGRQLELSRLQRELLRELEERTLLERSLREAKEQAEAANRAKSAFLANMSHELRTPLNAILGFAQILARDPLLNEPQREHARSIHKGGDYLLTLINDILDLSKIEAGRFELFPAEWGCGGFFREIVQMFRIRAQGKGVEFREESLSPLPDTLFGDEKRLRQVVINLLGNAVKFTEHGTVTLRTGFAHGKLLIEVADTGIGISEEELSAIFEPFRQSGSGHLKLQGTGLGLTITMRLLEVMEGTLSVTSTLGQGSTFRAEIPMQVVRGASAEPQYEREVIGYCRSAGEGAFHLLIVDDNGDNRQVLRLLLESLAFRVSEAEDGDCCLEQVAATQFDLILMDLRMPRMDGLTATRALRSQGVDTPIVALTAAAYSEDHAATRQAGCNAHLNKPVQLEELLQTLADLLPLKLNYQPLNSGDGEQPALEPLTPEQRERFVYLAKRGDILGLGRFAEELNDAPNFSQQLATLVRQFEIEQIIRLAKGMEEWE